jgi:putative copper export protein
VDGTALLQCGAAFTLNLALAWMVGVLSARWWLRRCARAAGAGSRGAGAGAGALWAESAAALLCGSLRWAAPLCLAGSAAALWAAAASMAGVPLPESGAALWMMLLQTAFGHAGLAGLAAMLALSALAWLLPRWRGLDFSALMLLLAYAASRVANSHAAEQGLLSMGIAIEYAHLLLVAQWVGSVAVAGWVVLPLAGPQRALARYLRPLSDTAAAALAGIAASGIYNAWHALGTVDNAFGNPYGTALLVKLVLVALAVALGGYNKLVGFPAAQCGKGLGRAVAVLRIESVVLAGALLAAAVLVSQQPPMAG